MPRRRPAPLPAPLRAVARVATAMLVAAATACGTGGFGWQGVEPAQLRDYRTAFERAAGAQFDRTATRDELVALLRRTRVLWLGDHHRHTALHRRQRQLLEQLAADGIRLGLCLESIGTEDEPAVARYLRGNGDLDALAATLRRRWPGSWLDAADVDADHYRWLLAFARRTGSPVRALEPVPRLPLPRRDAVIAANVHAAAIEHPGRLTVVVVGQSHLLGDGRLADRAALPSLLVGAEPTAALLAAHRTAPPPGGLLRSDAGLWFFADLLPPARART